MTGLRKEARSVALRFSLHSVRLFVRLSFYHVNLIVHCAWVYILTNNRNTVLYVGVTNNLATRLWEHRTKQNPKCFTARYNVEKLIYYEGFTYIVDAIVREKFIKGNRENGKAR